MTKENILDLKGIGGGHWEHKVSVHEAMDEWAMKIAIEFAEFTSNNTIGMWDEIWLYHSKAGSYNYTTQELYNLFINSKENK